MAQAGLFLTGCGVGKALWAWLQPAQLYWQPDLFSRKRWGPMATLWSEHDPEAVAKYRRRLRGPTELILAGEGSPSFTSSYDLTLWFRASSDLSVCALCQGEKWDADFPAQRRRGMPAPYLMYLYPASREIPTIVRWMVRDYLDAGGRDVESLNRRGTFDLSGVWDCWDNYA